MSAYRIAVLGNKNSMAIFRAFGAEVFSVETSKEAKERLLDLVSQHQDEDAHLPLYAIIFVEENFYKLLPEDILKRLAEKPLPAITPIPSPGSTDKKFGQRRLSQIVVRAIGSDIG